MSIAENLNSIKASLHDDITLVAVSKTQSVESILEAYKVGQRVFGENKVQEMVDKQQKLPDDIEWHMIGHLQRNKVKYMASFVSLVHGVDSNKLLNEINKQAKRHDRVIDCLLQLKIASEDTKFGMTKDQAVNILTSNSFDDLQNIRVIGVMGMASYTNDTNQVEREFKYLKKTFEELRKISTSKINLTTISMGMSGDYELAIDCGSTMVRIGSSIFGTRNY